jgi:hypothetical protein
VLDHLAPVQRLQRDVVAEPGAQHAGTRCRGEVVRVATARVVGVRVRDDGALDRPPRVDEEIARRAVQPLGTLDDEVGRSARRHGVGCHGHLAIVDAARAVSRRPRMLAASPRTTSL